MDSPTLTVISRRAGFRRAGRQWPAEAVTVAVADFTPEQVQAILDEPMLLVTPTAHPSDADAGPAGSGSHTGEPAKAGHAERADRAARLLAAVAALPDDAEHRTAEGLPEVKALRAATGLADVSAAERDAHVEAFIEHIQPLIAAPGD